MQKSKHLFTKIVSFLLVIFMLSVTFGCGNTDNPGVTPGGDEPGSKGEERIEPTLPDVRYDGYDFRILAKGESTNWWTIGIGAEEKNGDPVNDATLARNNAVKERFGVNIVEVDEYDVSAQFQKSVLGDQDDFDIAVAELHFMGNLAPKYTVDFKTIPWVDLTKPWYDQEAVTELSVNNHLYTVNGDLILNDENASWCVLYNPLLAEDYDVPNLYKMVDKKEWTFDKMFEIASSVTHEASGDDVLDENDIWGLHVESFDSYAMVIASGEKIASKDANDMPYLTANTEKFARIFAKAVEINGNKNVTFMNEDATPGGMVSSIGGIWLFSKGATGTGCSLFRVAGVYTITQARRVAESDIDIGVLPMPLEDGSQERYYTPITVDNATSLFVPYNAQNLERTGAILEALSAEARYTTRIAFYETTLKKKYSPDLDSARMLDLVSTTRVFDLGAVFGWGGILQKMNGMTVSRSTNWASAYKTLERVAAKAMEKTITQITTTTPAK